MAYQCQRCGTKLESYAAYIHHAEKDCPARHPAPNLERKNFEELPRPRSDSAARKHNPLRNWN